MKRIAMLAAVLAGCGGSGLERPERCDFTAQGVCVANATAAQVTPERFEAALSRALAYWGADPEALAGAAVRYEAAPCPEQAGAEGCTLPLDRTIWLEVQDPACFERSYLAHEVGHLLLPGGDREHADPRWRSAALSERTAATEAGCP